MTACLPGCLCRYETELNIRNSVEVDMASLRRMKDNLDLTISDLNMQVEGLKEELVNMKSSHKEVRGCSIQISQLETK